MTQSNESVEDGTEGGYTVGEIPAEQLEKMRQQRPEFFRVLDPSNFPAGYIEALIEKYGAVTSIHSEDLGDFGIFGDEPEFQFPPESTE